MDLFKIERFEDLKEEAAVADEITKRFQAQIDERREMRDKRQPLNNISQSQEKEASKKRKRKKASKERFVRDDVYQPINIGSEDFPTAKRKKKLSTEYNNKCITEAIHKTDSELNDETTSYYVSIENKELELHGDRQKCCEEGEKSEIYASSDTNTRSKENLFPVLGKQNNVKKMKVKRILPRWLNEPEYIPAEIECGKNGLGDIILSDKTMKNLDAAKISYLFPVQVCVIPRILLNANYASRFPPRDICVQSPTGSGKTLSYTLPIIEILSQTIARQLYCLVVLPSKDLAVQIKQVFDNYTKGTHLKVGLVSGIKTFAKEKEKLVVKGLNGYVSKVDILVCTPGRLVDHLRLTPGFSLKYLRFLVVDEADRLLEQSYSGWLELVMQSVYINDVSSSFKGQRKIIPMNVASIQKDQLPLQKLLFSATLTQNPEKLAPLELYHPMLFTCQKEQKNNRLNDDDGSYNDTSGVIGEGRFIIPDKLVEQMIVVEVGEKPLALVHLILSLGCKKMLCFTKSVEATHRLYLLLKSFAGFSVSEFSSSLTETQRKGIIRDLKNGHIDMVITTDAMARGMDIESVDLVVNYDMATHAKTHVHRVGRTARAGVEGKAITILTRKEVYHFKQMMKKLSGKTLSKIKITKHDLSLYEKQYETALCNLQDKVDEEKKVVNTGKFVKRT